MSEDPTRQFPESSDDKIDRLVKAVEALSNDVATMRAEVATSRSELSALSETVEHRLYDTRPMWETVLAEMEDLKSRMDAIENRVGSLETTVRDGLKDMGHLFRTQYVDVIRVQRDLEDRVTALEQKPA
jgi:ABC-type transporter Mla subunit MlaD